MLQTGFARMDITPHLGISLRGQYFARYADGMLDPLLDFEMRQWFCDEWERLGNKVELILSPTADHTIAQFDVNPATFEQLLLGWEDFMVREAIWPEPEVETDALMV